MPPRQLLAGIHRARLRIVPRPPLAAIRPTDTIIRSIVSVSGTASRTFTTSRRVQDPGQREDMEHRLHDAQAMASFQGAYRLHVWSSR